MSNKVTCLGKVFLIQDSLKTSAWKLQADTKNIGNIPV